MSDILVHTEAGVTTITFNRPDKKNSITAAMYSAMADALQAAQDDGDSLRVLRLLLQELPLKSAVRLAAEITGASRNALYDTALAWKRAQPEESS